MRHAFLPVSSLKLPDGSIHTVEKALLPDIPARFRYLRSSLQIQLGEIKPLLNPLKLPVPHLPGCLLLQAEWNLHLRLLPEASLLLLPRQSHHGPLLL